MNWSGTKGSLKSSPRTWTPFLRSQSVETVWTRAGSSFWSKSRNLFSISDCKCRLTEGTESKVDDTSTLSSGSVLKESVIPFDRDTIKTKMARTFSWLIFNCIGTIKGKSAARILGAAGWNGEVGPQSLTTCSPFGVKLAKFNGLA